MECVVSCAVNDVGVKDAVESVVCEVVGVVATVCDSVESVGITFVVVVCGAVASGFVVSGNSCWVVNDSVEGKVSNDLVVDSIV